MASPLEGGAQLRKGPLLIKLELCCRDGCLLEDATDDCQFWMRFCLLRGHSFK